MHMLPNTLKYLEIQQDVQRFTMQQNVVGWNFL